MNRNELFKRKFPSSEWGELFMVRNKGKGVYYISMKNGPYQVEGTPNFDDWFEAQAFLKTNWRKLYDEEFERQVLLGSEECETDDKSEDSSTT